MGLSHRGRGCGCRGCGGLPSSQTGILTDRNPHRQESSQTGPSQQDPHRQNPHSRILTDRTHRQASLPAPHPCLLTLPSLTRIFQCLAHWPPGQTCGLTSYTSLSATGLYTSLSTKGLYNSLTQGLTPYTVYTWGYTGLFLYRSLHLELYSCTLVHWSPPQLFCCTLVSTGLLHSCSAVH